MKTQFIGIGCNTVEPICDEGDKYTVEVYKECLDRIKKHGYTHVEYSHIAHLSEKEAKIIGEYTKEIGLIPWSVHSEHLNNENEEAIKEYFEVQNRCAENCAAMGAKMMVFHPPNTARNKNRDIEIITAVVAIAEERGLYACIENISSMAIKDMIDIVNEIHMKNLGFTLDTGHAILSGDDPAEVAYMMGKKLFHLHLQDNFAENDDHCPPGLGGINWQKVLNALSEIQYKGALMLELTGPGVKKRRTIPQLTDFPLEKEMVFGISYLNFLIKNKSNKSLKN